MAAGNLARSIGVSCTCSMLLGSNSLNWSEPLAAGGASWRGAAVARRDPSEAPASPPAIDVNRRRRVSGLKMDIEVGRVGRVGQVNQVGRVRQVDRVNQVDEFVGRNSMRFEAIVGSAEFIVGNYTKPARGTI